MPRIIESGINGLSVKIAPDGVWLNFSTSGQHAMINLLSIAEERGRITGNAIRQWCNEVSNERA
jgi:hypothetical protein